MRGLVIALAALVLAAPAGAAHPPVQLALANRPGVTRLAVTAAPGSLISGAVRVSATGSAPASVTLARADGTTAPRTGVRFVTQGKLTGVGKWLRLAQKQVVVTPHNHRDVGFSLSLPPKTKPGQYVGGIVAGPREAITLVITVPGPSVSRFAIASASAHTPHLVTIHIANQGNVIGRPSGTVAIANANGKTVATKAFRMGDFLPQTAIDYPLVLEKPLAAGTYVATVHLTYQGSSHTPQTISAAPRLVVSPKPVATQPAPTTTAPAPATTPTVVATAEKHTVPWQLIAAGLGGVLVLLAVLARLRRRRAARERLAPHTGPHYWSVDWERRDADPRGALRHLYRCRDCGVEVMARDVRDASLSCQ